MMSVNRGREQHDALAASIDDECGRMAAAVGGEELALLAQKTRKRQIARVSSGSG